MKFDPSLYLVTDRALSIGRNLEWIVKEAVRGGVTMVQLREKDCSTREFVALGQRLKALLNDFHVPLIINERIDVTCLLYTSTATNGNIRNIIVWLWKRLYTAAVTS